MSKGGEEREIQREPTVDIGREGTHSGSCRDCSGRCGFGAAAIGADDKCVRRRPKADLCIIQASHTIGQLSRITALNLVSDILEDCFEQQSSQPAALCKTRLERARAQPDKTRPFLANLHGRRPR